MRSMRIRKRIRSRSRTFPSSLFDFVGPLHAPIPSVLIFNLVVLSKMILSESLVSLSTILDEQGEKLEEKQYYHGGVSLA